MTEEAQRIAIAEACGRKYHKPTNAELKSGSYYQYEPDYLSDLNAMHEAEKFFNPSELLGASPQWDLYIRTVLEVGVGTHGFHSTAAQRAEAFLRAIGKWVK